MLLRLAVLNVQSGINVRRGYWQYLTRGWKYLLPHTAGALKKAGVFLRDEKTDIALCTEVEERALRSVFLSHARVMRTHARLDHGRFFPTRTHFPFVREGNAILTRYDIVSHTLHRLPGVRTPRVLGETVLSVEGRHIAVFVAHLGLSASYRTQQLARIAEILKDTHLPIILGGDFNERSHDAFKIFAAAGLAHLCSEPNFPSWRPRHPLAVLFLSHHFKKPTYRVASARFSDHLPLLVEAELTD